ncbi:FAD:protein FMN transferase [Methylicorpusculum sp.]|uniref:FAD:protein FMN transferase n=1 Tax=Methylicorpusculum sp. TaxID=2713644 RepID=UPI00272F7DA7|nr:FAD:protein FMN transferase [Methylicorpusculum sp.]MDP2180382.1 FAD:protein FMN transferase [Methylicorpusculum sp.]MDP3527916.1 FAD:protein FMN transferase [Methylicorpusculum sp.]
MNSKKLQHFNFNFKAMGSPCQIQLFAADSNAARTIAELALNDLQRLEQKYSRYREDSLLSDINRVADKGGRITLDAETAGLIDYANACYLQSDGLFDISSGILRKAWRFEQSRLPEPKMITSLLKRIGWDKVNWSPPDLIFSSSGMELDFGGIVKEYAADRVVTLCRQAGGRHGLVNLGGDVKIIGPRPDGYPWRVGIAHPRNRQALLKSLTLHQGAIASSGDYERCIVIDGKRYSHVLNPKTGWPVQHMTSVTVVSDHCVIAGSASTIAMLKSEEGPDWLEKLGLPYLWTDVLGRQGGSLLM